jgi:hypothetical protein
MIEIIWFADTCHILSETSKVNLTLVLKIKKEALLA